MEKLNCCRCTHEQSYTQWWFLLSDNKCCDKNDYMQLINWCNIERYKPSLLHFDTVMHDNHICCHRNTYICFIHLILLEYCPTSICYIHQCIIYLSRFFHNILFGGCVAGRVEGKCLCILYITCKERAC